MNVKKVIMVQMFIFEIRVFTTNSKNLKTFI